MNDVLIVVAISVLSGILYRMGGSGRYNTKARDIGCAVCNAISLGLLCGWHWSLIPCTLMAFGAYTTYWDFVNKWFNVKDPDSEYWWNWALHGFFLSLAYLWFLLLTNYLPGFIIRTLLTTVGVALWSQLIGKDVWEERGRGFIINITTLAALFTLD